MAITFVATGPTDTARTGNVTPGLPGGWQPNDIFICIIASLDNVTSTMPSGWIYIENTGTNNGPGLRTTTFYKIAVVGDKNPVVTHNLGGAIEAAIVAYRGIDTTNPLDVVGVTSINSYSTIVKATSLNTITDTAWVIFTGSISSKSTFSSYSGTPVPTERLDRPNATGLPSTFLADFVISPAGSTGDRTAIATTPGINNGLLFALRPITATIVCITDPSNANIYIDGILQPVNTSTSINVLAGNHNVLFAKGGYQSYSTNVILSAGQVINVCAILQQLANITGYGIVVCNDSNILSCPTTALTCPVSVDPISYVNFIAIIDSISPINLTVNFLYELDGIFSVLSLFANLQIGTNIIYAFSTNSQYPPNTIIALSNVTLS